MPIVVLLLTGGNTSTLKEFSLHSQK